MRVDFDGWCATVVALVVGARRTSKGQLENSNNEPMKPRTRNGVVEYWSDGWTPDRAWRRIPAYRINCVAAAGLRHSRAPGKRRVENRVGTGKWRTFSHLVIGFYRLETALTRLFPRFSTQVVDFPRMAMVRHFWEGTKNRRDAEAREDEKIQNEPQRHEGTKTAGFHAGECSATEWGQAGKTKQNHRDTEAQRHLNIGDQRGAQRSARPTLKTTEN